MVKNVFKDREQFRTQLRDNKEMLGNLEIEVKEKLGMIEKDVKAVEKKEEEVKKK